MRSFFVIALALFCVVSVVVHAEAMNVLPLAENPQQVILDIIRQVLDLVVEFVGDILDEVVRAMKKLFTGDDNE